MARMIFDGKENDYSNTKPRAVHIGTTQIPVNVWSKAITEVLGHLLMKDRTAFDRIVQNDALARFYIGTDIAQGEGVYKLGEFISDGAIYHINTYSHTNVKAKLLQTFLDAMDAWKYIQVEYVQISRAAKDTGTEEEQTAAPVAKQQVQTTFASSEDIEQQFAAKVQEIEDTKKRLSKLMAEKDRLLEQMIKRK